MAPACCVPGASMPGAGGQHAGCRVLVRLGRYTQSRGAMQRRHPLSTHAALHRPIAGGAQPAAGASFSGPLLEDAEGAGHALRPNSACHPSQRQIKGPDICRQNCRIVEHENSSTDGNSSRSITQQLTYWP
eukprot:353069-Chlamydomonas_euryale.AAC.11